MGIWKHVLVAVAAFIIGTATVVSAQGIEKYLITLVNEDDSPLPTGIRSVSPDPPVSGYDRLWRRRPIGLGGR